MSIGIDIESVLRTNFAPEGHQAAKDRILRNTHEISAWCIQCKTKNHSCTINSSLPFWNERIGSMYHCTYELPDLCDFEILHEASQISFNVHLAHIFSKCGTIRAQVTSGLSKGQRRITITRDESGCVEALRTVIFYLYTGFIIDLSLLDTKTMTSTEASRVELSYDAYELYKIAEFLDIEPLTELLVSRGINIFGPRCSPNDCRQQLASLLFRAQGDDVLMKGVLKAIREVCRSPSILLLYPLLYSQDTWDSVMETTKESFMLCPGVFIMYSILFSTPTPALAEMINRFRDQMVEGRPSNWCTPLSETLAGADLRVLLSDEFCTEGSSIPLFRGPPLFVKWATNRKEFENIVTHFNLFTLSAVLRNNDILFPPWVVELIDTMGEVRDATTMPTSGRLQAVHRLIHKQHADPVHALITERMQRVIPRGNAFTIGPLFMSVLSEGLRLLQVFKDRKMVVSTSRKRKAAVGASE